MASINPVSASRFLFFQAEDGIRDFCLSRGLGDVYKRQLRHYKREKQICRNREYDLIFERRVIQGLLFTFFLVELKSRFMILVTFPERLLPPPKSALKVKSDFVVSPEIESLRD